MPNVSVRIPTPMLKLTGNKDEVKVQAGDITELLAALDKAYPGARERLCDEKGEVRRFINVFLNDEDIRFMDGAATKLKENDTVSIVPAIAGGSTVKKKFYLNVPQKLIKQPIIYELVKKYDVIPNIRQASVSDELGIVALELEGDPAQVEKAVRYLSSLGVTVDPIEINVIEG